MAGKSNQRAFTPLQFRRLLRNYIFARREKIPLLHGAPVEKADKSEAENPVFAEPFFTKEFLDGLKNEGKIEKNQPSHNINVEINDDFYDEDQPTTGWTVNDPVDLGLDPQTLTANDRSDDFIFDEFAPDVQIHIAGEEGMAMYAGWLGKGSKLM